MMNKVWFVVASPKTHTAEWKNIKEPEWEKYDECIPWGIPDSSKDIKSTKV